MKLGKYKHYKGKFYEVIGIGKLESTLEEMVVYKALYDSEYGEGAIWLRPKEEFFGKVAVDGEKVSRFELVK